MMGTREPLRGGAEWDAFTRWRRCCGKRAGRWAAIKRKFWRRVRKLHRLRARAEAADA
jgi:hypothetical protein